MQPQRQSISFEEQSAIGYFFADWLSVPLLPLFRRRIGLRTVSVKFGLAIMLLMLLGIAFRPEPFSSEEPDGTVVFPYKTLLRPEMPARPGFVALFAVVAGFLGARQASARQRELKRGIPWHSYHRGISIFDCRFFRPGTAERHVDPFVVVLAGFATWYGFSVALGAYFIMAGFALRCVEQRNYLLNYRRTLDAVDSMIDSGDLAEDVGQFSQPVTPDFSSRPVIKTGKAQRRPSLLRRLLLGRHA